MNIEDLKINHKYQIDFPAENGFGPWLGTATYLGLENNEIYPIGTLYFMCDDGMEGYFRIEHVVSEIKVTEYLIWSIEHDGWWNYNSCGYTKCRSEAKRYSLEDAIKIVKDANIFLKDSESPKESIVPDKSI